MIFCSFSEQRGHYTENRRLGTTYSLAQPEIYKISIKVDLFVVHRVNSNPCKPPGEWLIAWWWFSQYDGRKMIFNMLEDIFILRFDGADPVDFMTRSGVCFVQGVKKFDVGLSKVGIDQERPPCIIDQMKKFLVSLMACNFYGCGTAVHFVKKSRWVHGENEKNGKKTPDATCYHMHANPANP